MDMIKISDHLEKLPIFLEVVRSGSIRSASKNLNMSQPSVSRTIQILEESVDQRLLVRGQTGVQLTEFGQRLLDLSQKIHAEVDQFQKMGTVQAQDVQKIKFGTYESIAVYFFPKFLRHILDSKIPIDIDLLTASSDQLVDYLKRNIVDAILSVNPPQYASLISKKLFDDHYGYYHAPGLKLTVKTPIIFFPDAKDYQGKKVLSYIKESTLKDNPHFVCESFEPIRALAIEKIGLGVLPARVASSFVKTGELVEWKPDNIRPKKFGKHAVFFSFLKRRNGDRNLLNLLRSIENFQDRV
ncbi:MAG: LysR family transcriptional regulator [Bdellovibrionaceae bacterium]|nr:LysR family transcriptional regulator [Pseudobdellovibrionaceae bacterium]